MENYIEKNLNKKLTKKDYLLYLLNRNIFIVVSPLVILALVVVFVWMVKKDGYQAQDLLYLLPVLLFGLSYFQMYRAINSALEANSKSDNLKVILDEKKYKEVTSNGENSLDYNKFYSFYESKNYYYLYVDKVNALILPKREFTQEELTKMNGYFKSNIKKETLFNFKNLLTLLFSVGLITCTIILIVTM